MKVTTENLLVWSGETDKGIAIIPEFAITQDDGVIIHTYYRVLDVFNSFAGRALKSLEIYEEYNSRMTKERLVELFDAMLMETDKENRSWNVVVDLINKGKERTQWPIPTRELIRTMASVSFFDETETPWDFDQAYNIEVKLPLWREAKVDDFFLGQRLSVLVPFPPISKEDFENHLRVITGLETLTLKKFENILPNAFPSLRKETI